MAETAVKPENEMVLRPQFDVSPTDDMDEKSSRERALARIRLLWDRRRLLYRAVIYAFLASALIALLIPVRYESSTRLMPPDNQSSSGLAMAAASLSGNGGGLGAAASELLGLKTTSDVFVGILSSRTVQDKLIQQFDLKKVYGSRHIEDARKTLANHTAIAVDRKSQIITITVTDGSSQRAAAIAGAYVEELNRLVVDLSTSSARRERIFIEGRLQTVTRDLEEAEKEFGEFASKNAAIDIKEQGKAMVEAAATLQGQLIAAQSELQALKQTYTDENVRVRAVNARIHELQGQLEKMGGKAESASTLSSGPDSSLYPSIRKLPLLGVTFADLYRRTKVQEVLFETLTKEYEMAKVEEAKEIPSVKVLDAADVPEQKSYPPRTLIVLCGTVLGLAIAVSWIFVHDVWEGTDPGDPRRIFAQEVFSTVAGRISMFGHSNLIKRSVNGVWQRIRRRKAGDESESR